MHLERASFRSWLSDLLGAPLDGIPGRTRLTKPDELDLGDLLGLLIKANGSSAMDPTSRRFRDRVAAEHEVLVEKLNAVLARQSAAEAEVDEIVFELYGVTEGLWEAAIAAVRS